MSVKPAANEPPQAAAQGARPYEMKDRGEDRVPVFGFEDLSGWTVECLGGADASLVRTQERQLWGEYVGKLAYKGASPGSGVVIRPPKPISIPGRADSVSMWIYGNNWGWITDPKTPQVQVSVLIRDSDGRETEHSLTNIRWEEWWLAHRKLQQTMEGASFAGIRVGNMSNTEERTIFLDSIYFCQEHLSPLAFQPRPKRNVKLFEGQDPGLNTGPGTLPFPTREQTILPTNFTRAFKNSVVESGGVYEFLYVGDDCRIAYRYRPVSGDLGDIEAYVNGRRVCTPMRGGGIQLETQDAARGRLTEHSLNDGVLSLLFDFDGVQAQYAVRIWQKSLVIDFICRGGKAAGLTFGEIEDVESPRLVLIPFLTLGSHPRVLCAGQKENPWFMSVWADWYRSNASELWSMEYARVDTACVNGGTRYVARTDGKRNDLFERVFLTVSPTFEECLPTVDNPASKQGRLAGERLWQESWGPDNYEKQHARSRMLRSYGIEKLTQCNHEIAWRDGGESFTLRTSAAPGKGGDEALKTYVGNQQSLGWLSGLYTNYTDFAPVNEYWHPDLVQRDPKGEWRPAWPRCYALKPSRAVELDARLAPVIKKKFGSNAAYTDVHTAVPPWYYCDYDSRVPGAASFASTFYAYGELLLNDQRVYGPTWSEGSYHWLYAGLATGNYGLCYPQPDMSRQPLNVAFDLMKIHPLECDIGMPWTGGYFKDSTEWQKPENIDRSIDQFIAATIAYGHIGWLVEEVHGINRTCRSYYMLQQLQKRYAMVRPATIEYADGEGNWLTASQAVARDVMRDSRLHVAYENGLQVYVNGSCSDWRLPDGTLLSPWGWYARDRTGKFVEFSAMLAGHRVDYVNSSEYRYLDGRGERCLHEGIGARGAIAVRKRGGNVEIVDIYGNDEIGIKAGFPGACVAYDAEGKSLGRVETRSAQDGMVWFRVRDKARSYVYTPKRGNSRASLSISAPKSAVVPGESLPIVVSFKGGRVKSASLGLEGHEPHELRSLRSRSFGSARLDLQFSEDLKTDSSAWLLVRVELEDGAIVERWHVFEVVPAFGIRIVESDNGRIRFEIDNHLLHAPETDVSASLRSGKSFSIMRDQENSLSFTIAAESAEADDALIVTARAVGFSEQAEFAVNSVLDNAAVADLAAERGFSWGFAFRGGSEVLGNIHGVGEDSGALYYAGNLDSGGVMKNGIFTHPPWKGGVGYTYLVTSPLVIPGKPCEFRCYVGIKDGGAQTDGVTFKVVAVTDAGEREILNTHWKERRWNEVRADLSEFCGSRISIKLIADVGPADNSSADWACWGEPRIVEKQPLTRVIVRPQAGSSEENLKPTPKTAI